MSQIFWLEEGEAAKKSEVGEKKDTALCHRAEGGMLFKKRGEQEGSGMELRTRFSKLGGHWAEAVSMECQEQGPDWSGLWREWEVRKRNDHDQLFQELGCEWGRKVEQ